MKGGSPLLAAVSALLALAPSLGAQTQPMPALPPLDGAAPPRLRPWDYSVAAGVGWDGNIDFVDPHGPRAATLLPRGAVTRTLRARHGEFRADAAGRWVGYAGRPDLRRYYADLSLDALHHSSPTTDWRAHASYGIGDTASSEVLLAQGVALPRVKTRSLVAGAGVSTKIGPRASLRAEGRFFRTEFDAPGLVDGNSVRATFGLEHRMSARSTVGVEYSLEDVLTSHTGSSYVTHFASLQWSRVLSGRSAVLLEGGGSHTPEAARAGLDRKDNFFGGASFTRKVALSTLTVFLRREVTPAFGLGVSRLELRGGLGATVPIGRAWQLRLVANHAHPQTPRGGERAYGPGDDAFASLGRRLGRTLEVSAEVRYRRRGATSTLPAIDAFQAGVFLTLLGPGGSALAPVR